MNSPISQKNFTLLRDRSFQELRKFYQKPVAKVSIELMLTIGAVLFLALFAIRPTLTTMSRLLRDIEDREKVNEALTRKAAALSTLDSELVPLQNDIQILATAIPNDPDVDGLLRRVEKIASTRPVELSSIQANTVPVNGQLPPSRRRSAAATQDVVPELSTISLEFQIKGQYADIKEFLTAVTDIDRYLTLEELGMSTDRDQDLDQTPGVGASPQLQFRATLRGYYYGAPLEKDPSTVSQPRPAATEEEELGL